MNQSERRLFLLQALLNERAQQQEGITIPERKDEQKRLLRALFNVRMPEAVSPEFLRVQDEYLQEANREKGITDYHDLEAVQPQIYLWQGDITSLRCDAIVNAANSQLLGCFLPNHSCIDNCIHTFAGVQLRQDCFDIMTAQGHEEATGMAKITPGYNLPAKYVIHTVGPIVEGPLTREHEELLADCYRSCLELAEEKGLQSIAFCCISTGVFMFPNQRAAEIAIETVQAFKRTHQSKIEVIFNVFKDSDKQIYQELLGTNRSAEA